MDCRLTRIHYLSTGIFGTLTIGDDFFSTLEHAFPTTQDTWEPKVKPGSYLCSLHAPNRLPYTTYELQNVPDFQNNQVTGILIHIGNYNKDSDGCILLGMSTNIPMILSSEIAFKKFMAIQQSCSQFRILIE